MTDSITTPEQATKTFADFGVNPHICEALADAGITSPFPIQELTLPLALAGADLIGQARTGTGKTLAFGIPLLQRVDQSVRRTQALVIVPTRELCVQVTEDLARASGTMGLEVVALYGGKAIEPQAKAVENGAHVVVGTPGRLLDLMRRGSLRLGEVNGLVLDEADEMLDLGFLPDVEQLIEATAENRQTLLFSATMPSQVVALARRYMHKPTFLRADVEEIHVAPETQQYFFSCHRMDKPAVLARVLQTRNRGLCVVFTRTKRMADVLAEELRERGVKAAPIHSDLRQEAREKALARFRKGTITVLVATEVAARGLDIDDVTHVVNYDCPDDEKMYLHRIGRTGRAGAAGVAITMAVWNELARLEMIKKALDITDPTHEVFSTSPILDELFDLPSREELRQAAVDEDEDDDVAETEAPPAPAPSRDDDGARGGGGRRSRGGRGRGGKGRGRDGDSGPTDERTEVAEPASSAPAVRTEGAPAQRAETAARDDSTGERRTRTRTRTRAAAGVGEPKAERTTSDDTAERPAQRDAAERPAQRDASDREATDSERVRVRRRTRSTATSASSEAAPASRSAQPDEEEPRSRAVRTRREGGERGGTTRSASGRNGSGRSGAARETSKDRGGEDTGRPDRARSDRRGQGRAPRPERDGRSRRGRERDPRPTSDVDADAARGAGRPVITRPLKIQHLP